MTPATTTLHFPGKMPEVNTAKELLYVFGGEDVTGAPVLMLEIFQTLKDGMIP